MKTIKLKDNINTDDIIPAKYCNTHNPNELAKHAFKHLLIKKDLQDIKIITAGKNFGCGSSREHAPLAIKGLGVKKIIAKSFSNIFYRNAINVGLEVQKITEKKIPTVIKNIANFGGLSAYNIARLKNKTKVPKSVTQKHPMTITEKILAKASKNCYVKSGELIFARPDIIMSHDAVVAGSTEIFYKQYGKKTKIKYPQKFIFVADHFIQVNDIRKDNKMNVLYNKMVNFAKKNNIKIYKKIKRNEAAGICHILLPEQGHILPGQFVVGTDSHSSTYGSFNTFAYACGTTDLANLYATGDLWLEVPESIKININGKLNPDVTAKDIILFILKNLKTKARGKVIEFYGEVIDSLSMDERQVLSNMSIEAGALCGIMMVDKTTRAYLKKRKVNTINADKNANYVLEKTYNISHLRPQVSCPYSPINTTDVNRLKKIKIDVAYIGSCTGGKFEDLKMAAQILQNKNISKTVKLYIVPATQKIKNMADKYGYLDIFKKSGAIILPSGCGACINAGIGSLSKKQIGIFATNRNFKGRNGHPSSQVYLASPITVAKSAIAGFITN